MKKKNINQLLNFRLVGLYKREEKKIISTKVFCEKNCREFHFFYTCDTKIMENEKLKIKNYCKSNKMVVESNYHF